MNKALKRGLIIGLAIVLIACVGGIAALDIPVILLIAVLVIALGVVSYIAHNRKGDSDD